MIAYEVLVNGERKCLASLGENGYMHAHLSVGQRSPSKSTTSQSRPLFWIGGMINDDSVHWLKENLDLKVGDDLTIRIVEIASLEEADVPIKAEKSTNPRFK